MSRRQKYSRVVDEDIESSSRDLGDILGACVDALLICYVEGHCLESLLGEVVEHLLRPGGGDDMAAWRLRRSASVFATKEAIIDLEGFESRALRTSGLELFSQGMADTAGRAAIAGRGG
jgi:hypothetical protein